jgi:adenylate kinase family enzyme
MFPTHYRRIVIVGASGAGKSSLAEELSCILRIPCFELDGSTEQDRPESDLQAYVHRIAGLEAWIVPADYTSIRQILWPRAEAILWLDYPLPFALTRLARREFTVYLIQKVFVRQTYSNFWMKYLNKLQAFRRAFYMHRRNRRNLLSLLQQKEFTHIVLLRFKKPAQTSAWVSELKNTARKAAGGATISTGS